MITIDVIDELETKTEKTKAPKRRLNKIIWWGIWKINNHTSHAEQQAMIDLSNLAKLDEININKWRIR